MPQRKSQPSKKKSRLKAMTMPPPRNPLEAWGDVLTDAAHGRKRLARMIAKPGSSRKIKDYRKLVRDLGGLCHSVNDQLYERIRSDSNAVCGALGDLESALEDALSRLGAKGAIESSLGYDAAKLLKGAAEDYPVHRRINPGGVAWRWLDPKNIPPSGEHRIEWVKCILWDCIEWTKTAKKNVAPRPPPHRAPDNISRAAVVRLVEIWREQTGQQPTLTTDPASGEKRGDFLEFCQATLHPVWLNRQLDLPSLAHHIQATLYPPKNKTRSGRN